MVDQDYEAANCPVCMEPPHNAVLLLCSSHDQGCRALLCDTGSNLSNCLSKFLDNVPPQYLPSCPLCRGQVSDYTEVEATGRNSMNARTRSCPHESCVFTGNYSQLVYHASQEHPLVNPSDMDESRLLEWERLEEQERRNELIAMGLPRPLAPSDIPISQLTVTSAEEELTMVVHGRETRRTYTHMPMIEEFARGVLAGRTLNWRQRIGPVFIHCYQITPDEFLVQSYTREAVPEEDGGGAISNGIIEPSSVYGWRERYYIRRHSIILEWQQSDGEGD